MSKSERIDLLESAHIKYIDRGHNKNVHPWFLASPRQANILEVSFITLQAKVATIYTLHSWDSYIICLLNISHCQQNTFWVEIYIL